MARFNQKAEVKDKIFNREGFPAFSLPMKLDLYSKVCTASLQKKFYDTKEKTFEEIRGLVKVAPVEFTARLAVYARENLHLRSIPLVLAVELARISDDPIVARVTERVIQRADELAEILSYYAQANGRSGLKKLNKIDKQLQKGVARAFDKFDEYQFAKYNRDAEIKLRDVMFLVHPKPVPSKVDLYKKIADKTLDTPYTWEVELSASKGTKKETWEKLIDSKKVGYMALLRNLRNILEAGVSLEHRKVVARYLGDQKAVLTSKQMPFRFLSAYKELEEVKAEGVGPILDVLEAAVTVAARNIEGFDDTSKVLIACDTSASMDHSLSDKSKINFYEIGMVLGMLLRSRCPETTVGIFGEDWKVVNLPSAPILGNTKALVRLVGSVGHSTNGYKVLQWAIRDNREFDRLMFFTDCQWWDSGTLSWDSSIDKTRFTPSKLWVSYKQKFPKAKFYYFDVAGYGNTPIRVGRDDVYFISGWNEEVFKILSAIERGSSAVEEIERMEI